MTICAGLGPNGRRWRRLLRAQVAPALGLALAFSLAAGPAAAFRCTQANTQAMTSQGPALSWPGRNLTFTLQADGTAQLPLADTFAVLRAAFVVWQGLELAADAQTQCGADTALTDITFNETPQSVSSWTGYDFLNPQINTNLVVFRDSGWQAPLASVDVVALTTTTYSALTGEIFDADIEFNSANYAFVTANPTDTQMDLLSTAVHEIGHFLGLAHCTDDAAASCGHGEVMEPQAAFGTIFKRQLQCDDRDAIAFKYPAGALTRYCATSPGIALGTAVTSGTDVNCSSGCLAAVIPTQVAQITSLGSDMGRGCQAAAPSDPCCWLASAWLMGRRRVRQRRRTQRLGPRGVGPRRSVVAVVVLLLGSCGCQAPDCPGPQASLAANAPRILHMALAQQVPNDPWRVVLTCDFVDPDGDLGAGTGTFTLTGDVDDLQTFALANSFAASAGLSAEATSGRLQLLVRFDSTATTGRIVHLCTQLVDAAGHPSNSYRLDLNLQLANTYVSGQ